MKKYTFKKTICAALAALTVISSSGCGSVSNNTEDAVSNTQNEIKPANMAADPVSSVELKADKGELSDKFNMGYAGFTAELFKNSCCDDLANGKNVLISPESVMFALGMTANGANGDTLTQMEDVLGGEKIDTLNDDLLCLMHKANDDEDGQLRLANSIWTNTNLLTLKQDYADKLRQYYAADSFNVVFGEHTHEDMNAWISNNTKGMIQDMLDKVGPDDAAYLINTAVFDAEWGKKYEDDDIRENSTFYAFGGEMQDCTLLYSEENIYLKDDDTEGFVKPYKDGKYGFMALLPNDVDKDLADYVSGLDAEKLNELWNSRQSTEVDAYIPEFSFDYDLCMNQPLMDMGMTNAFENADFSNMAENSSGLRIDKVLHSTHIELDRKGTKAAAATAVVMTKGAVAEVTNVPVVRLDRPFVYAIVDMDNGMPVFIGAVNTLG